MIIPLLLFWILLFLGREELGFKGIVISVTIWLGLLLGSINISGGSPYFFTAACALLDIVLLLVIFGGDINVPLR
jgi:hypothetical protein